MFAYSLNSQTVLSDPKIGPYHILPLQVRVDFEAMAMKESSTCTNLQGWSLTIRLFSVISGHSLGERSYPSAEIQSVYSTASANWLVFQGIEFFFYWENCLKIRSPCQQGLEWADCLLCRWGVPPMSWI